MSCVEYLLVIMICLATRLPPFDGWSFGYFSQFPLSHCGQFDCMHFILGNRLKIFSLNTSFSFSLFVSSAYLHFCCCFFSLVFISGFDVVFEYHAKQALTKFYRCRYLLMYIHSVLFGY